MMNWLCKHFNELSLTELYKILQLRNEVFIVEQRCPYQDLDTKDKHAVHVMKFDNDELVAYTRLLPQGISYNEASIGRVLVKLAARKSGYGKELMHYSIEKLYENFGGPQPIKIGAQLYLKQFYESLGFIQVSDVYDEDGIDHIKMLKPAMNSM